MELNHTLGAATCVVCRDKIGEFRTVWPGLKECRRCGHRTADMDSGIDFARLYGKGYFHGEEYSDYLRDRRVLESHFRDRLATVRDYCPAGRLIEIGSAYGFFLVVAGECFKARGYDICEQPLEYARTRLGLDVRCENFSAESEPPGQADVVAMWDTVEHLPRPDLTVEAAYHALRPGGHLFLTTGDAGSLLARYRGQKWRQFHPPTHIHYFTKNSLRRLLENAGFELVRLSHVGARRSVQQICYSLFQLNKPRPSVLYTRVAASRLGNWSFPLNTFDIMLAIARISRG